MRCSNTGTATNANNDTYQSYDMFDAFVNLGKWKKTRKELLRAFKSSGTAKVLGSGGSGWYCIPHTVLTTFQDREHCGSIAQTWAWN